MKFTDYNPEELIGKKVLFESGMSYSAKNLRIARIEKVTKTGFRINESEYLFGFDGHAKGLSGRQNMAVVAHCVLVSEEQALNFKKTWYANRVCKQQKEELTNSITSLTKEQTAKLYESLKQITQP